MGAAKDLIIDAMRSKDEAKLKSILAALWHLSANSDDTKSEICAVNGALGFLLDMLDFNAPSKSRNGNVAENASGVLKNVSSHVATQEEYRSILRDKDCTVVLLRHLKSPSMILVNNVCGILNNLSKHSTQDRKILCDSILDSHSIPVLQNLARSKHKVVSANAQIILKNLLRAKNLDFSTVNFVKRDINENVDRPKEEKSAGIGYRPSYEVVKSEAVDNYKASKSSAEIPFIYRVPDRERKNRDGGVERLGKSSSPLREENYDSVKQERNRSSMVPWNSPSESTENFDRLCPYSPVDEIPPMNELLSNNEDETCSNGASPAYAKKCFQKYRENGSNRSPIFSTSHDKDNSSCDEDANDQPVDYSKKYLERNTMMENKPNRATKKEFSVHRSKVNLFGDYAETDLDQPTDYSLRYAEDDTDEDEKSERGYFVGSELEDTVQTYCTEGTPYETPFIFSTATSMSDLRSECSKDAENFKKPRSVHEKSKETSSVRSMKVIASSERRNSKNSKQMRNAPVLSSGIMSPEKPVNYCEEGTPGCFSRVSSLSSLNSGIGNLCIADSEDVVDKPMEMEKDRESAAKTDFGEALVSRSLEEEQRKDVHVEKELVTCHPDKVVTFGGEEHCAEQTPLMFSRCSSLSSLSGFEQQSIHEDRSSISDVSRMTSGVISPSELPDSPTQTVPTSPKYRKTPPRDFPRKISEEAKIPIRQQLFGKSLLHTRSIFEDAMASYKEESTPVEFSAATSLSSLTIDDEPCKDTKVEIGLKEITEVKVKNTASLCNSLQLKKKSEQVSDGDEEDEDILAACINMGMQSNRYKQTSKKHFPAHQKQPLPSLVRYPPCSALNRLETTPPIPIKPSSNRKPKSPLDVDAFDTMHVYCTEDTPAYISPVGSHSNLSVLSLASIPDYDEENAENDGKPQESNRGKREDFSDEGSNLSGDEDNILDKCIMSGMPKEHPRHKNSIPMVKKFTVKPKLCGTPSTSPVDSVPDNSAFSPPLAISVSEMIGNETYDDSPNRSEDEAILAECIKSAMPKTSVSLSGSKTRRLALKFDKVLVKGPHLNKFSKPSGSFAKPAVRLEEPALRYCSSSSEEEDDIMLAQCIESGMPKGTVSRSRSSVRKK